MPATPVAETICDGRPHAQSDDVFELPDAPHKNSHLRALMMPSTIQSGEGSLMISSAEQNRGSSLDVVWLGEEGGRALPMVRSMM